LYLSNFRKKIRARICRMEFGKLY